VLKFLFLVFGLLASGLIVAFADVALGLYFQDWSGIHPVSRIPVHLLFLFASLLVGIFLLSSLYWLKGLCISKFQGYFCVGLVLGMVNIDVLVRPFWGAEVQRVVFFVALVAIPLTVLLLTLFFFRADEQR